MIGIVYIILALSVPLFYVVGAATFLKVVLEIFNSAKKTKSTNPTTSQHNPSNQSHTSHNPTAPNQLLFKLYEAAQQNPSMTISSFVHSLHSSQSNLYTDISQANLPNPNHDSRHTTEPSHTQPFSHTIQSPQTHQTNWFSENTISFFLFVGAVLIVAAVAIFVSFQWSLMSPATKLFSIGLFNLAWFVAGFVFYRLPKMRLAGTTFLTLGSLLFPLTIYASYYLIFSQSSTNPGYVMLTGAGLGLGLYLYLSFRTRRYWFTYLAGLSLAVAYSSFVLIFNLTQTYYVVMSLLAALTLLFVGLGFNLPGRHQSRAVLEIAHAVLVLSLSFGVVMLLFDLGDWLSIEVASVLLTTAGYLWLCYRHYLHPYFLVGIIYTSSFALVSFLGSFNISPQSLIYILSLTSLAWLVGPLLVKNLPRIEHFAVSAIFLSVIAYVLNLTLDNNTLALFLISLIVCVELVISWPLWRRSAYEYVLTGSWLALLIHGLRLTSIDFDFWPLICTLVGATLFVGLCLSKLDQKFPTIKTATLVWVNATGLWAIFADLNNLSNYQQTIYLYAAWLITIGTTAYSQFREKTKISWYIVSFQVLMLYIWVINQDALYDIHFSTLPLGVWILVANYFWRYKDDNETPKIADVVGLGVILLPGIMQSSIVNQALITAVYSLVLMLISVPLNRLSYRLAGFAALLIVIIVQSADYIMALPRWLLVGGLGMIILSLGVVLLSKRNQSPKD